MLEQGKKNTGDVEMKSAADIKVLLSSADPFFNPSIDTWFVLLKILWLEWAECSVPDPRLLISDPSPQIEYQELRIWIWIIPETRAAETNFFFIFLVKMKIQIG